MTTAVEITLDIELEDRHWFYDSLLHAHYMLGDGEDELNRGELLSLPTMLGRRCTIISKLQSRVFAKKLI